MITLPGAIFVASDAGIALSRAYSLLFAIGLAYALANGVSTARRAWFAAIWLMLSGLALAALGLVSVDWLVKYPALEPALRRLPRVLEAIPHPTFGSVPGTSDAGVHPNNLAGLLVLVVPLAVACAVPDGWLRKRSSTRSGASSRRASGRTERNQTVGSGAALAQAGVIHQTASLAAPSILRGVALATLAGTVPVLVLTQSRGAMLGLAVSLAALLGFWMRHSVSAHSAVRRRGGVIGAILAALAVIGVGVAFAIAGLQSDRPDLLPEQGGGDWYSPSASGRLGLWRDGMSMLAASPLTGIGLHNFPLEHGYFPEQDSFVYKGYAHVHNQLLQAALDFGLPGLVAVVGLFVSVGWAVHRIRRRTSGSDLDPLVVGLALGLVAHVTHGLVDAVAIGAKPGFIPWAFVGLIAAIRLRVYAWSPSEKVGNGATGDLGAGSAGRIMRELPEEPT